MTEHLEGWTDFGGQSRGVRGAVVWRLRSGSIDEVVRAGDQWAAWETLRHRPASDFGLIASAEPDESADPFLARVSGLMFWWGRDADAEAFIRAAVDAGMPDTTDLDRRFGR